jgi:hypothetical protein
MLAVQAIMMSAYLTARHRVQEMVDDERGGQYGMIALEVLGIAVAIALMGILYAKWQQAAQSSPTGGGGIPAPAGGAPVSSPVGGG